MNKTLNKNSVESKQREERGREKDCGPGENRTDRPQHNIEWQFYQAAKQSATNIEILMKCKRIAPQVEVKWMLVAVVWLSASLAYPAYYINQLCSKLLLTQLIDAPSKSNQSQPNFQLGSINQKLSVMSRTKKRVNEINIYNYRQTDTHWHSLRRTHVRTCSALLAQQAGNTHTAEGQGQRTHNNGNR